MLRPSIAVTFCMVLSLVSSLFFVEVSGTSKFAVQWRFSCPDGTYENPVTPTSRPEQDLDGHCLPCSQCGPGLYVAHPCRHSRDTVCDSCHTYRGPHNRDFKRRCLLFNVTGRTSKRRLTSSDTGTINGRAASDIGYDGFDLTTPPGINSDVVVDGFSMDSAKSFESVGLTRIRENRVNSSADLPVVPSNNDYWWLHRTVNVLFVMLCAALCYVMLAVYRLKQSPIKGYKVITKIEDV